MSKVNVYLNALISTNALPLFSINLNIYENSFLLFNSYFVKYKIANPVFNSNFGPHKNNKSHICNVV